MPVILLLCHASVGAPARAQTCEYPRVLIVLDKSSSMVTGTTGGQTKWAAARNAVTNVVTNHGNSIHFGLMVYPATSQCAAGVVNVDIGPNNAASFASYLATPPPSSGNYTPTAQSLDVAGQYGPLLTGTPRKFVLLITDGWQWCYPYDSATRFWPVDAVKRLRAKGIKTFVVGFGSAVDVLTLNRMAYEGGTSPAGCNQNGTDPAAASRCYFQTESQADLDAALAQIARVTSEETCDGQDNDCDGFVDNATPGNPAPITRACASGCGGGVSSCIGGQWTECRPVSPQPETCDGEDNDCDGYVDNAAPGDPAPLTRSCNSDCGSGVERCERGQWVGCTAPEPTAETCDGTDNDCDGYVDNARKGRPEPLTRPCSTACGSGVESCIRGQWQGCTAPAPAAEICGDNIDNNCDGRVDEGCECQPGEMRPCGTHVGECRPGTQRCTNDGRWGDCEGGQQPVPEICDGLDNNCNGVLDDGAQCAGDAICACGGCAEPCLNGECFQGSVCLGGYCVFDRCPAGMHCEGTACVPGERPVPVAADAGTGPVEPPPREENHGGVAAPAGCSCDTASASPVGLLGLGLLGLALRPGGAVAGSHR